MDQEVSYQLRILSSISEISADRWNALAQTTRSDGSVARNPFLEHAFLSALEASGSAAPETGWYPRHMVLETSDGQMLGAIPCYLKTHSQGEYVFDHGWADAFYRAGGEYYPKLQCAVPFTPATGPRLLSGDAPNPAPIRAALLSGLKQLCERTGASSAHITFMPEDEWQDCEKAGYLLRTDRQFHWLNKGYGTFDDFLGALSSRKRKNIRKERKTALDSNNLDIELLRGEDISESALDAFFAFYMDTGSRKWGQPYLTREFFTLVSENMGDDVLFVMVRRAGKYIAGAINFIGDDCLYGRHWGCTEHHPFLHFEVCYYQAIDYAIENGLARVEAGAQGEHKLARGYVPVTTHSAHHIANPGFRDAVEAYLQRERQHVEAEKAILSGHTPFRRQNGAT